MCPPIRALTEGLFHDRIAAAMDANNLTRSPYVNERRDRSECISLAVLHSVHTVHPSPSLQPLQAVAKASNSHSRAAVQVINRCVDSLQDPKDPLISVNVLLLPPRDSFTVHDSVNISLPNETVVRGSALGILKFPQHTRHAAPE